MDHQYDLTRADGTFVRITPVPNAAHHSGGTWLLSAYHADGSRMIAGEAHYNPEQVIGQIPVAEARLFRGYLDGLLVKEHLPSPKLLNLVRAWALGEWDLLEADLEALAYRCRLSRLAFRTLDELDRRATFDATLDPAVEATA